MPTETTSIATLRALPVPSCGADTVFRTAGYRQAGDGGGETFDWVASSALDDNGGTVIACTANTYASGRYIARSYGAGSVNVRQWGAHPILATPAENLAALQKAHDSLPVLSNYLTDSGRTPRMGVVLIPAGRYTINGTFFPYSGVTVRGEGWRNTTLVLDNNVFTNASTPQYMVQFEISAYPVEANNHFGAQFNGISLLGNADQNAGSAGLLMNGAQGTLLDDVLVGGCGTIGVDFTGVHIGSLWVEGCRIGPSLIIHDNATTCDFLSLEHQGATTQPYLLILGPSVHINSVSFETSSTDPVKFVGFGVTLAKGTTFDNVATNTESTDATIFNWGSNGAPGLFVGEVYNRGSVPVTTVYDNDSGVSYTSRSFCSDLTANNSSARVSRSAMTGYAGITHTLAAANPDPQALERQPSPANGSHVEFMTGNILRHYVFSLGDTATTNDPSIVRDVNGTGAWHLVWSYDPQAGKTTFSESVQSAGVPAVQVWRCDGLGNTTITHDFSLAALVPAGSTKPFEIEVFVNFSSYVGYWKLKYRLAMYQGGGQQQSVEAAPVEACPSGIMDGNPGHYPTSPVTFAFTFSNDGNTLHVQATGPSGGGGSSFVMRVLDQS